MSGRPTVTVLMGVYNGEAHVSRAVRSILDQTFTDFEFLIIDDGSRDGTAELVGRLAADDPRIRFLRNPHNQGLGYTLHRGVELARAPLVARMDADDFSVPSRLQRQVEYLRHHPEVDVLGGNAVDVDQSGVLRRERHVPTAPGTIARLIWACPIIHPTVMFRRESVLRAGSYSQRIRRRQDYELWFRCIEAGLTLANLPEVLLEYRYSEETLRRNNARAMAAQSLMGLRGCWRVRASPLAYLAVTVPFLQALLPGRLRTGMTAAMSRFDPRSSG